MPKRGFCKFIWISILFQSALAQETGSLTVNISGFKNDTGQAMVAVHQNSNTFLKRVEPYRRGIVKIQDGLAETTFNDLPWGSYSISVFHDENANQDLDAYFGIIPKEDYGFSNNVRKKYGPPKYKETVFRFEASSMTVAITLMSALKKEDLPKDEEALKRLTSGPDRLVK